MPNQLILNEEYDLGDGSGVCPVGTEFTCDADTVSTLIRKGIASPVPGVYGAVKRPHIAVGKERFEDSPTKGFKTPAAFLQEVMETCKGVKQMSPQMRFLAVQGDGTKAAGSDEQSVAADPYGGFLVPESWLPDTLKREPETDFIMGRTRHIPMKNPIVNIPARVDSDHSDSVSGGLTLTRREEMSQITASRVEMEKCVLHAHSLFGLTYTTEELLADSGQSFVALLADSYREQFADTLLRERINGAGVGEMTGVTNAACTIEVAKETGQAAETIVYENACAMLARCWHYQDAMWLANHNCRPQIMQMAQTAGVAGFPAWQPSARVGCPDTLFGLGLVFTEHCQTLGTAGDILLVNWREYLEGILQPLDSAESIHARFDYHERAFKFWLRNAGTPWWRSVLTPVNGSTLSPFVKLAVRA